MKVFTSLIDVFVGQSIVGCLKSILGCLAVLGGYGDLQILAYAEKYSADVHVSVPISIEQIYASNEFTEVDLDVAWAPSGSSFIKKNFVDTPLGTQDLVLESPTGERTVVLAASELLSPTANADNPNALQLPVSIDSCQLSNDSNLLLIYSNSRKVWRNKTRGDYWIFNRTNKIFRKLGGNFASPSSLQFAKISPDSTRVAYVFQNNIYSEEIVSGKIIQLTFDGNRDIINGTFDWVYEEEFGCCDGFRWSPDSKKIAFWRLDSSLEPDFFMLDDVNFSVTSNIDQRVHKSNIENFQTSSNSILFEEGLVNETPSVVGSERLQAYPRLISFKYPRVGLPNAEVTIGIVSLPECDLESYDVVANTKFVSFDESGEYYLPSMEWYNEGGRLIVQRIPRSQRSCSTYLINPETGTSQLLYNEEDKGGAWQTVFPIFPIDYGDFFLRVSEQDGWRRFYLSSFSSPTKFTPITLPNVDVIDFVSFDYDSRGMIIGIYYYASPDNATQRFLYRASISGVNERVVVLESMEKENGHDDVFVSSSDFGFERWIISPDSNWAICYRSSFGVPNRVDLVKLDSASAIVVNHLVDNIELREKIAKEKFGKNEFFKTEIDSNFDFEIGLTQVETPVTSKVSIDGWIMLPRDWDPTSSKKYPVLVYVYGEPASQTVVDLWGGSTYLFHRAIAERGCVVLSFDGRGTPAPKGRTWRKCIYQKLGAVGRSDQVAALRQFLSTSPYATKLDTTRIGVWGWSGGGTSTLNLLFNYPDLYSCGIAVAPVADYRNYDSIYQERYSGLLTETPESYFLGSPIHYAKNLQGKLLLIHGSGDDNCHYQTSEQLINALIEEGKDFELFTYPGRSHGIGEGNGTTLHLRKKMLNFWERNLL